MATSKSSNFVHKRQREHSRVTSRNENESTKQIQQEDLVDNVSSLKWSESHRELIGSKADSQGRLVLVHAVGTGSRR